MYVMLHFLCVVKSFIDLARYLFTLLISQDLFENFLGLQRQQGTLNENPTVKEFCNHTQALRVINCSCINIVKGNCRGNKAKKRTAEKESQPLRKRSRIRSARKGKNS